LKDEP